MNDTADLILVEYTNSPGGTPKPAIQGIRNVLCDIQSIGLREHYKAMSAGFTPEIKLVLADFADYGGEKYALYARDVYKVIRAYRAGRRVELSLERTRDLRGLI